MEDRPSNKIGFILDIDKLKKEMGIPDDVNIINCRFREDMNGIQVYVDKLFKFDKDKGFKLGKEREGIDEIGY